ncbi:MAG: 30S ribosomal protein S20 [Nannocystaceae bacterium]
MSSQLDKPGGTRQKGASNPQGKSTSVANHKQAAKRNRQRVRRRTRNLTYLSSMRTYVKRVRKALAGKEGDQAIAHLPMAIRSIDRAVARGVLHRNTGSRYISRLTVAVQAAN